MSDIKRIMEKYELLIKSIDRMERELKNEDNEDCINNVVNSLEEFGLEFEDLMLDLYNKED